VNVIVFIPNVKSRLLDDIIQKEIALNWQTKPSQTQVMREDISQYVAELQLHMTLQARNLVPSLDREVDSRIQLLRESQAELEKMVSRQSA
jgi:hypothetical protein